MNIPLSLGLTYLLVLLISATTLNADVVIQGFEGFTQTAPTNAPATMTNSDWIVHQTHIHTNILTITPRSGLKMALLPTSISSGVSGTNSYIESPELQNGVGTVEFYLRNRFTNSLTCELRICTNGVTWSTAAVMTNASTAWTAHSVALNRLEPIRFRIFRSINSSNLNWIGVDDITTTEAPAKVGFTSISGSPAAPTADDNVNILAQLAPSTLASNIVATLYWSSNGGSSNAINMTYNSGSGRYETSSPITNQPAFAIINYTMHVTFQGPYALSPVSTNGSFFLRQGGLQSAYSSFSVKGGLFRTLELFDDAYWIAVTNVGALGTTDIYFESVSSATNRWRDPAQIRTALPVFGAASTNAATDIRITNAPAGWLMFSFDEGIGRYGIQQADVQSFDSWSTATAYSNHTIEGWTLTQGRTVTNESLRFSGRSVQFTNATAGAIESLVLTNGIGTILFRYRNTQTNGASPAAFTIQTKVNSGDAWQTAETVSGIISPDYISHRLSLDNLNLQYIRIAATNGTAAAQLLIDDIIVTRPGATIAYAGLTHSPTNTTITNTVTVSVDITPRNGAENMSATLWFRAAGEGLATTYAMPVAFTNFVGRGTLTNFPALVKLTTANTANYTGFLDTVNGWDLRFWTNSAYSGTALDYEIESFNGTSNSFIWVKVPRLTQNTTIWATWGHPDYHQQVASTTNGTVWTEGYRGVWHLNEGVTNEASGGIHYDSTTNRNHGTQYGNAPVNGISGNGQQFDGNGDYIDFGTNAALTQLSDFTIEAWVNTASAGVWYQQIIGNYGLTNTPSSSNFFGLGWTQTAPFPLGFIVRVNNNTSNLFNSGNAYKDGQWHHLVGTKQGSVLAFFADGVRVATNTLAGNPFTTDGLSRLRMGWHSATNWSTGIYDAPRLSSAVRSTNWVWACYMNQGASHNAFASYGSRTSIVVTVTADGGIYDALPLTNTTGYTYSATIPRGDRGVMEYYIETTYLNPATGGYQAANEPIDRIGSPAAYNNTDVALMFQGAENFPVSTILTNNPGVLNADGWAMNEVHVHTNTLTITPHSGSKFALLPTSSGSGVPGTNSYVQSPELQNGVGTLSFYLRNRLTNNFTCDLYTSTNGIDWDPVAVVTNTSAAWTQHTVTINRYEPVSLRIFRSIDSANANWVGIDSISLTYPPAYVTATNFTMDPAYASEVEPITVDCTIESATTFHPAFNITGTLKYRIDGSGAYSSVPMTRSGSHFYADIPAMTNLTVVDYYVEAGFNGYSAQGENRSPMTFPETPLDYTVRRFASAYDRMAIRIGTNTLTDFEQLGNGWWEGLITFIDATNQPAFGIDSYGYYDGTTIDDGFTATWGDNTPNTTIPLEGTAIRGANPIVIPEEALGQYIVRFNEETGLYSVQRAVYQNFEHWPADGTSFGESFAADYINQHIQTFQSWPLSEYLTTENFESEWTNVSLPYPSNWSIPLFTVTEGNNRSYLINDGIVITQLVGQAALLNAGVLANIRNKNVGLGDAGSFSFDLRCASPNDFRPALYSSLTNRSLMISAWLRTTDLPTNSTMDSVGYAYKSIIGNYIDSSTYYEARIAQASPTQKRYEIWEHSGGISTNRNQSAPETGSIADAEQIRMLLYRSGVDVQIRLFSGSTATAKATWNDATPLTAMPTNTFGINGMDASLSVSNVNVYVVTNALNVETNLVYTEGFTNSPAGWDSSAGAWTVTTNGVYRRDGYTGSPIEARVEFSETMSEGSWVPANIFSNLTHSAYRRYTGKPHNPTNGYVRVMHASGNGYLIIDNLERSGWRGKSISTNGWLGTNVWVGTATTNRFIELRNSRALAGAPQDIQSPPLVDGGFAIAFDYRKASDATGPVAFSVDYTHASQPENWVSFAAATNSSATNWVHVSYSIADRALRSGITRMRIRNLTAGYDDGLLIDNIEITETVPINYSTWWGYNALITEQKPSDIIDNANTPWLARLANNDKGAFINNSTNNGTGGATYIEYVPFIQSAYLPDGIGEIRFLYRAWDTNASTIQIVASTNRYTPGVNDWAVIDTLTVDNTAYQEYNKAIFERDYNYMALRVNSLMGNLGRVAVDNILITAPLAADLRLSELELDPPIPLPGDDVYVKVKVDDFFFSPSNIVLQLMLKNGTNTWGDYTNGTWTTYTMPMITNTDDWAIYRSIIPIPKKAIDSVVQYQVKATFEGLYSNKTSPKYYRNFINPDHYWPVNLNRDKPNPTPYYIVLSCLPGRVWINEFNIVDVGYSVDLQFIELAGSGSAPIGNWKVESIHTDFSTNASYTIPGGTTIGSEAGDYGFYVIGTTHVTPRNQEVTNTLPFNGGIQLIRPVASIGQQIIEQQVCYDEYYLSDGSNMTLSADHRYVYAGYDDDLDSTSLFMAGSGSNRSDFVWSYDMGLTFSIGTTNTGQTLIPWPTNGVPGLETYTGPASIGTAWRSGGIMYMRVNTESTNLVPQAWYTTNLLNVAWTNAPGSGWSRSNTTYTVWITNAASPAFYSITVKDQ